MLSVVFVGMTNNPARSMTPPRLAVCQGATGRCAMFMVSNTSSNQYIWFNTASVEQKTETGWQLFIPYRSPWSGVEGMVWPPGSSGIYAVGWPPGMATNACWRLNVRYGREPPIIGIVVNQKTGRELFPRGKEESTIQSSDVKE
jgi:hypothetical protein